MIIARITGTKAASGNATVEQDHKGIIAVTWDNGEVAQFEDMYAFKPWLNNNRFIAQIKYVAEPKDIRRYKDMTVTREQRIECGADWQEQLKKTGDAGHHVNVVTVTRHHKDFDEVLINDNPLFKEAVESTK